MKLKKQIDDDLKVALLKGDHLTSEVLRGLKAVVLNEEIIQNKRETGLLDDIIEQLIAKEVKKRQESAELYQKANRQDLVDSERAEAEILRKYLPKQLTAEEIKKVVQEKIAELKITEQKEIGKLIGAVKQQLGNTADSGLIAKIVKEELK